MMRRLKSLRLVVSHTQLYRKLDEYGQDYDASVKNMMKQECDWMKLQHVPLSMNNEELLRRNPVMNLLLKVTQQKLVSFHVNLVVKN